MYLCMALMMKYSVAIICTGLSLIIFPIYDAKAKMACASKDEKKAFDTRALQSHLMVAALSCDERQDYNVFIKKHSSELIKNGEYIKTYFKRNYERNADIQMNQFITALANASSKKSLDTNSDKFCAQAVRIFKQVSAVRINKISDFAARPDFANLHKVTECN